MESFVLNSTREKKAHEEKVMRRRIERHVMKVVIRMGIRAVDAMSMVHKKQVDYKKGGGKIEESIHDKKKKTEEKKSNRNKIEDK